MTWIVINQGGEEGDGWTVENTDLPNVIGWGDTYDEAVSDLNVQTESILDAVVDAMDRLNHAT